MKCLPYPLKPDLCNGEQRLRPLHTYYRKIIGALSRGKTTLKTNDLQKNDLNLRLSSFLTKISLRLACQGNSILCMVLKDGLYPIL